MQFETNIFRNLRQIHFTCTLSHSGLVWSGLVSQSQSSVPEMLAYLKIYLDIYQDINSFSNIVALTVIYRQQFSTLWKWYLWAQYWTMNAFEKYFRKHLRMYPSCWICCNLRKFSNCNNSSLEVVFWEKWINTFSSLLLDYIYRCRLYL